VTAREENGQPFKHGGDNVNCELQLMGSDQPPVRGDTVDNKDGTYSVSFTPQETGEHKLSITIHNKPIKGSPFVMYVREPRDYTTLQSYQQSVTNLGGNYVNALSFHEDGKMYIAQNDYIRILKPDGSTQRSYGSSGSGDCQFSSPEAVAVCGDTVYVCDSSNHRIQKLSTSGNFISKFGVYGTGEGQLNYPRGICIDPEGKIFVADYSNNCIQIFVPDGTFVSIIPPEEGNIKYPWGVAFDSDGNLHVACYGSNTIKVFMREGKFLEEYGQGQLTGPAGIAVDEEGYSFVVEFRSNYRFHIFEPSHKLVKTLSGFSSPTHVSINKEGFIFVCDGNNHHIQKY